MHALSMLVAALGVIAIAGSSDAAIYRCRDAAGGVLYADAPCAGGAIVDIAESRADPAAIERLRRDALAFEARHALRSAADAARERAEREAAMQRAAETPPAQDSVLYAPVYGYAPLPLAKPLRGKHASPRRINQPQRFIRLR